MTTNITLGYQVTLKSGLLQDGESFKIGRSRLKADDVLRCISVEGENRLFVSQRTGTGFCFSMDTLRQKFHSIGFDGLEDIS